MNRTPGRPTVRASAWGTSNGEQIPIVRIYGGAGKRGVAVAYDEIDDLIAQLQQLKHEHERIESLVARLFPD